MNAKLKKLALQGEEIYSSKLKEKFPPRDKGRYAAIDIESEDYFVGNTLLEAIKKAKEKYPDKKFHLVRIGHKAAVSFKHRTIP